MKQCNLEAFLLERCTVQLEQTNHTVLLEDAFLKQSTLEQTKKASKNSSLSEERVFDLQIIRQLFLHLECYSISTLAHLEVGDRFEISDLVTLGMNVKTKNAILRLEALEERAGANHFVLKARAEEREEV